MRKSIRRTTSNRKKSVYNKYNIKSRTTKNARNKLRNHKKSRKQIYIGGWPFRTNKVAPEPPHEVTDWWYHKKNESGNYEWEKMNPDDTVIMNNTYSTWSAIPNPTVRELSPQYIMLTSPIDVSNEKHWQITFSLSNDHKLKNVKRRNEIKLRFNKRFSNTEPNRPNPEEPLSE